MASFGSVVYPLQCGWVGAYSPVASRLLFFYITSCVRELITLSSFFGELGSSAGSSTRSVSPCSRNVCDEFISHFVLPSSFSVFIWCCFSFPNMINDHGCRLFGLPRGFRTPYMPCTSTHISPPWLKHFTCIFQVRRTHIS